MTEILWIKMETTRVVIKGVLLFKEKFADAVKDVMKEWRTIRIISQILHILKFPSTNNLFFINFPEDDPINFGCICTP